MNLLLSAGPFLIMFRSSGREKYKIHNSEKFACFPDRHLIDGNPFRTVLLQVHIDLPWNAILLNDSLNMSLIPVRIGSDPRSFVPPVRLRGSRQIHPFQDIRLALRIITVKNIRGMIKFNIQYFIISVIFNLMI